MVRTTNGLATAAHRCVHGISPALPQGWNGHGHWQIDLRSTADAAVVSDPNAPLDHERRGRDIAGDAVLAQRPLRTATKQLR
ncbi:hypothetical protein [Rhodanobacter sp. PCA2]|uniref:hypothetical protein n=1 Tax=Rhodanobacter sp. PCA2 TaxID=2006117 RepID=UPI0015E7C10B|nr:hypothetical protein [Rhodanobacter sp. PCA2]